MVLQSLVFIPEGPVEGCVKGSEQLVVAGKKLSMPSSFLSSPARPAKASDSILFEHLPLPGCSCILRSKAILKFQQLRVLKVM